MMDPSIPDSFMSFPDAELGDHNHDGFSHDESCLPPRGGTGFLSSDLFSRLIYGSGPTFHQHAEYASHDDNCLEGNGCVGLGLAPGVNDRMDGPPIWDLGSPMPFDRGLASAGFSRRPATMNPGDMNYDHVYNRVLGARAMSLYSEDSPSQPREDPHDRLLRDSTEGDVVSGVGSGDDSCDGSQCCTGPCSPGLCGKLCCYSPRLFLSGRLAVDMSGSSSR